MAKRTKSSKPQKRRKKSKSKFSNKFLLPVFAAAIIASAVGGYWVAENIFAKDGSSSAPKSQSLGAFIPPSNNNSMSSIKRQNPFIPWNAYEETLPDDIYDPSSSKPQKKSISPPVVFDNANAGPNWLKNSIAYDDNGTGPLIAIVIDDMGVDRGNSKKIWELPPPLTLSFLTYADDLSLQTSAARKNGHELMLHISMEPGSKTVDAGPNVLITGMEKAELRNLVTWGMDRFNGYMGINNHMGSRFTEDRAGMEVVLQEISKRGLMFLDSRTSAKTVGPMVAEELGVPHLERNVFLDNEPDVAYINKQLAKAEKLANSRGIAIAIGHPRPATVDALGVWIPKARARGIRIAPLSAILKYQMGIVVNSN